MLVNIIGAGRVGQTLACLFRKHHLAQIGGVVNRSLASAVHAVSILGEGRACVDCSALPDATLTLLTTPDDQLPTVCHMLLQAKVLRPGQYVVHCSGSLSSTILADLRTEGVYIASLHPMQTFAAVALAVDHFPGTYCAIEGDEAAFAFLAPLLETMGAYPYRLSTAQKALYHVAGVFASNYMVTLADVARQCLKTAGLTDPVAKNILLNLMHGSLANFEALAHPREALTGPLQRGDAQTIQRHLQALSDTNDTYAALYASLGLATLPLTTLDEAQHALLSQLFNSVEQTTVKHVAPASSHPPFGHLLSMPGEKEEKTNMLWEDEL